MTKRNEWYGKRVSDEGRKWKPRVGDVILFKGEAFYKTKELDFLFVSIKGEVFNNITGNVHKRYKHSNGYEDVCVSYNGSVKHFLVHRLVANTFIPNPGNKLEVNHIDSNKINNHISNLEWVTRDENARHAATNNLMPSGYKCWHAKLSDDKIRYIILNRGIKTQAEMMKELNLSRSTVQRVVQFRAYKKEVKRIYEELLESGQIKELFL